MIYLYIDWLIRRIANIAVKSKKSRRFITPWNLALQGYAHRLFAKLDFYAYTIDYIMTSLGYHKYLIVRYSFAVNSSQWTHNNDADMFIVLENMYSSDALARSTGEPLLKITRRNDELVNINRIVAVTNLGTRKLMYCFLHFNYNRNASTCRIARWTHAR